MFLEGKVHGHAKVYLSGGDTFTGQFRFGVRKGWGALTQVSSEEVEGFWSEGAFMYSCRDGDEISFAEAQQHASEACTDSLKLVDIIQMDIVRVAWQVKRQVVKLCFALEKESKVDMSAVQHLDEISETMSTATWHSEDIEGMLPQTSIPSGVAEEKPLKESDVSTRHIDESLERPTNIKSGIENEDTKMLLVDMQKNLLRSFGRSKSYLRPDTVEVADDNNPPTVILGSPRVHQIRGFIQQKFGVAEEPEISNNQILERRVRSSPADTSKLTAKQYALLWKALRPVTVQLNEGEEIPETSKYLWMKDNYDQNSSASSIFDPSPPSYPPPSVDGTISLAELDDVSIHPPNHPPASIDDGSPPCHSPSDENTDDEPDNINDGLSVISGVKPPLDEPSISSNLENSITNVIIENTSPMISPFAAPSPRFFGAHSGVFSISSNLSSPRRPVVLPPRPPLRPPPPPHRPPLTPSTSAPNPPDSN